VHPVQGARGEGGSPLSRRLPTPLHPTLFAVWAAAGLVFALDRWTKAWAVAELALVHTRPLFGDWLRLTYVRNTGVAFGLGAGQGLPLAAVTFGALVLVVVLALQERNRTWTRSLALGLVVGGAAGNLLDRVRWGSVVDFIDFGFGRNMFPVFNAADSAITLGVDSLAAPLEPPLPAPSCPVCSRIPAARFPFRGL
jgi:signal peptidase II